MNNLARVFVDVEADNQENKRPLLQLSAIKIIDNKIFEFNQFCFQKRINSRISNLLKKERNFFNNNTFKTSKEVIQMFYEFSKDCNIYSYGNLDNEILSREIKENNMNIKIKVDDVIGLISSKLKSGNRNNGLIKISKVLGINSSETHDALDDAKTLWKVYDKVLQSDFNHDDYKLQKELIKYLPSHISSEYVDFKNAYIPKLSFENNFVLIESNIKDDFNDFNSFTKDLEVSEEDLIFSDALKEFSEEIFIKRTANLKLTSYDNNLNKINELSFKVEMRNEEEWKWPKELQDFIMSNKDSIFLTQWRKPITDCAKKTNTQFLLLNYQMFDKEYKNLKNEKVLSLAIQKVKEAIKMFK